MKEHNIQIETTEGDFSFRAVALIIQNNRLLVAKHIDHDCYYTVGGRVKLNEMTVKAVVREAFEETGHIFDIDRLLYVQERFTQFSNKNHHEVSFFYLMKEDVNVDIPEGSFTDQPEKESLHWLSIDRLSEVNLVPEFLKTSLRKIDEGVRHIIVEE